MQWSFRPMVVADLPELLPLQRRGAVVGLADVFPQDTHPFPADIVEQRWRAELVDPTVAAYVATDLEARLVGFAARRADEILHFGTALDTWGSGLAAWMHDALVATYPPDVTRVRLWVFADNGRGRRFYEKLGWQPTGERSRTSFAPHPELLEYTFDRAAPSAAG